MYLSLWQILTVCVTFGACAVISRRSGFVLGATATLEALEKNRFIKIEEDGSIKRWTPYAENPAPVKKTRKKAK